MFLVISLKIITQQQANISNIEYHGILMDGWDDPIKLSDIVKA